LCDASWPARGLSWCISYFRVVSEMHLSPTSFCFHCQVVCFALIVVHVVSGCSFHLMCVRSMKLTPFTSGMLTSFDACLLMKSMPNTYVVHSVQQCPSTCGFDVLHCHGRYAAHFVIRHPRSTASVYGAIRPLRQPIS